MDSTYNPHQEGGGSYGHGHTAWYAPQTINGVKSEFMASGLTETFTYDGCDLTLKTVDDPAAQKSQGMQSTVILRFNLRDIDPSSIKISERSHLGDFSCEPDNDGQKSITAENCDHAEMSFETRNQAGLISDEWDTIFPKLTDASHENKHSEKSHNAYFEFDDVEYAKRFRTALTRSIRLCGGKASPF